MAAISSRTERDLLSNTILNAIQRWSELDREIFTQAHYQGQPVEAISNSFNLSIEQVQLILEHCDHKLHTALRGFREGTGNPAACSPPHAAMFAACECFL